jgi:uncharacterized protein (TIGR02466 family)
MNIHSLFPIAIGMDRVPKELTSKELKFLTTQQMHRNEGNVSSIDSYILDNNELMDLRNELLKIVRKYFKAVYAPADDVDVYITQSWVNSTEPSEFHHAHKHYNSFISGVFYIHSEQKVDKIQFHKTNYEFIKLMPTEWNAYNALSWWYPVGTGDVILFPSSLSHEVPVTESSSNRISLAFNVFLKGRLGDCTGLTELKLT